MILITAIPNHGATGAAVVSSCSYVVPSGLAASARSTSRPAIPAGSSLLGVFGSLSATSSPAAAGTKSCLVHGCRNIRGKDGSERTATAATPIWPRRPDEAPMRTLPRIAAHGLALMVLLRKSRCFHE
jgi:hypothetical protein